MAKDWKRNPPPDDAMLRAVVELRDTFVLETLIADGGNVNARDKHNATLLHHAAASGNAEIVKMLIDGGAKLDEVDQHGQTPLICATTGGDVYDGYDGDQIGTVRLLVDAGANPNVQDDQGMSAIDHARDWNYEEVEEIIAEGIEAHKRRELARAAEKDNRAQHFRAASKQAGLRKRAARAPRLKPE